MSKKEATKAAIVMSATALSLVVSTKIIHSLSTKKSAKGSDNNKKSYLLAGDIGGTNTRLAVYNMEQEVPLYHNAYLNSQYVKKISDHIEETIIEPFLRSFFMEQHFEQSEKVEFCACFAVAGPVQNNCAQMTNLENLEKGTVLHFDGKTIQESEYKLLKCIKKCVVVNDFVGQGYGTLTLNHKDKNEVLELTKGSIERIENMNNNESIMGPKACIGAGTGLGQCFLTPNEGADGGWQCWPSEGGHVDFAVRNQLENELADYLKDTLHTGKVTIENDKKEVTVNKNMTPKIALTRKIETLPKPTRISVERIVSGKGLANVYKFLSEEKYPNDCDEEIHSEFLKAGDMQGKVVGTNADTSLLCGKAMEIMMGAYGSECGNCALKFLPTSGLYVTGGLTPKNISYIRSEDGQKETTFEKAYWDKGRLKILLETIPFFAVMVEDLGLRGARFCAKKVSLK